MIRKTFFNQQIYIQFIEENITYPILYLFWNNNNNSDQLGDNGIRSKKHIMPAAAVTWSFLSVQISSAVLKMTSSELNEELHPLFCRFFLLKEVAALLK